MGRHNFFLVVLSSCVKFSGSFIPRLPSPLGIRIYSAEMRGFGQLWAGKGSLKPGLLFRSEILWFLLKRKQKRIKGARICS